MKRYLTSIVQLTRQAPMRRGPLENRARAPMRRGPSGQNIQGSPPDRIEAGMRRPLRSVWRQNAGFPARLGPGRVGFSAIRVGCAGTRARAGAAPVQLLGALRYPRPRCRLPGHAPRWVFQRRPDATIDAPADQARGARYLPACARSLRPRSPEAGRSRTPLLRARSPAPALLRARLRAPSPRAGTGGSAAVARARPPLQ